MHRKLTFQTALCALLVAVAPAAMHAQCPAGFVMLDLKAGTAVASPAAFASNFSYVNAGNPTPVPASASCPAAAGWKMAAVQITIPATCTQANVTVEYEGLPQGYTVNLGDSPTNDAHAGDGGTTEHAAEIWIAGEDLSLALANQLAPFGLGIDNPLVRQHLALNNAALKLVVRNQFVSWSQPYSVVQTPATNNLFAIPDNSVVAADARAIYLGLNRVISGRLDRTGCGARRALLSFQ